MDFRYGGFQVLTRPHQDWISLSLSLSVPQWPPAAPDWYHFSAPQRNLCFLTDSGRVFHWADRSHDHPQPVTMAH
jgi:hypothetical protein